jgi:hypothetical protein
MDKSGKLRAPLGLAALFAFATCFGSGGQSDDLLKIDGSVQPKRLSRGEEGRIILKLQVQEGVFLSAQPFFIIEFAPLPEIVFPKNFFTASDLNISLIEEKTGSSIDLSKVIEIPFTISLDAKPGGHILEGRIKYFARSPGQNWCYKTTSKFSVAFSTRTTVFKKK